MNTIKLIATDIDGTLLNNESKIPEENLSFIDELAQDNIYVVLVSSRPLEGLPEDVMGSNHINYSITSNGAVVYDHKNKNVIANNMLEKESALELLKHVRNTKAVLTVATSEGIMTDRSSFVNIVSSSDDEHAKIVKIFEDSRPVYETEAFELIIDNSESIEKIHLNYGTVEDKDEALDYLFSIYGDDEYHITSSYVTNVEITHKDATKYTSVMRLVQELDIDPDQVLTIGDGTNDIEMFKVSKHSVAMLNGDDVVKAKANFVTDVDNDNSGWSKFISSYFKK